MISLTLSGGGARGAYQVGVLKSIAEICEVEGIEAPFQIYNGVSAGAINVAKLASYKTNFSQAVQDLESLWSQLRSENIFLTDAGALGKIGLKLFGKLSLGGLVGAEEGQSLLDTQPLQQLIRHQIDYDQIEKNFHENRLYALCISAINYKNSQVTTFIQSSHEIQLWKKARKKAEKIKIQPEHILASASIPLLFPPQQIGQQFYGDGCLRNQSPSSPAIYLGANKLFIIGVRSQGTTSFEKKAQTQITSPSIARVINTILNAILLDAIEYDIERIERINNLVNNLNVEIKNNLPLREIDLIAIQPSEDIGQMAIQMAHKMPRVIRYLIKGLGPIEEAGELISYLLFEKDFCQALIEMGYYDAQKHKDDIRHFLINKTSR